MKPQRMTLTEQMALIDQIVKKDPDITIKDYLLMVKEFDEIRGTVAVPIIRQSGMNEFIEESGTFTKETWNRKYQGKYLRTYKINR